MDPVNLKSLSRSELERFILESGEKRFRADQIWSWMYAKCCTRFEEMTDISRTFRTRLESLASLGRLKLVEKTVSPHQTAQKYLWELEDGLRIESVTIRESDRRTFCISSQVGCRLGCAFCATGGMGFHRNLGTAEIVQQVLEMQAASGERPTNLVVMGMGEPFLNYDAVIKALSILNDCDGFALGHRKITISTAGIVPVIDRFTAEAHPFKLAVSLNAGTDSLRSELMPVNRKYPIHSLLDAVRRYTRNRRKRVTFEYVVLAGVNHSDDDARRIRSLLHDIPCKVNLIAYNTTNHRYTSPDPEDVERFAELIRPLSAPVTLRLSRGEDISAACGQLAVKQSSAGSARTDRSRSRSP